MKLLIFEPCSAGHRLQYVRVIIDALRAFDVEIIVVAEALVLDSPEYAAHLKDVEHRFRLDASVSPRNGSGLKLWISAYRAFYSAVKRHRAQCVVVPFGDGFTQIMGLARLLGINPIEAGVRFDTVLFRGKIPGAKETIRERIGSLVWQVATWSAGADAYHLLNPFQYEAITQEGLKRFSGRCYMLPEPVEKIELMSLSEARKCLNIPEDGRYIACLGRLDRRKGADLLIKAFAKSRRREDDRLLLLGAMAPDVKDLLEKEYFDLLTSGQIVVVDRYLSQHELEAGLCAGDVICTPYPQHLTSSGFVVRAAAVGKPVLAADVGWMGKVVPMFDLGDTCNVSDISGFANAISTILNTAASFSPTQRTRQFARYHSIDNCYAHWREALSENGSAEALLSWDSVRGHHV